MGKKSSPSPPPAPDPLATAQAQALANKEAVRESAIVNQIREITPYGELRYEGSIGEPDRARIMEFSPETQAQFDLSARLADVLGGFAENRAGSITSEPFSLPSSPSLPEDFSADARSVQDATYARSMGLLDPGFQRERRQLETRLAQRGIPEYQEAYGEAYDQLDQRQNEAKLAAAMEAIRTGGSEQSRLYGLSKDARQQAINEQLLQRSQPINELAALLQGSPAIGQPQFSPTAQYQVAPPDILGAQQLAYQGQLAGFNAQNQRQAAGLGGLYSLGGSIAGALPWGSWF